MPQWLCCGLALQAIGKGALGRTYFQTLSPARYQQVWGNRNPDRAQILGRGIPRLTPAEVSGVVAPILLMRVTTSPKFFAILTARSAEFLPIARIAEIANASHLLHDDKPSTVNSESRIS